MNDSKIGITLGITMVIHNFPEGMAVAIPTYFATKSKTNAILLTVLSGISEPLGAILGWLLLNNVSNFVYGAMYGFVAGIMIIVTLQELLPNSLEYDPDDKITTKTMVIGMGIVALLMII